MYPGIHLVTSKFVTECLPKEGFFYENGMTSLDPGNSWLACGVWINGYDYQNSEKSRPLVKRAYQKFKFPYGTILAVIGFISPIISLEY